MGPLSKTGVRSLGIFGMLSLHAPVQREAVLHLSATFHRVDPASETLSMLGQAMGLRNPTEVLRRFAAGRRCYAAWVEGTLASYGWVTFDEEEMSEVGLRIRLTEREAYIWDCATVLAYRGQHLYPALLAYMVNELRAENIHRVWIGVGGDNLASQRGLARAGFQPVIDIVLLLLSPCPLCGGEADQMCPNTS